MNAPIIIHDLTTGARLPVTDEDIRALGSDASAVIRRDGRDIFVRRLDYNDPMDQREIWRLAALACGFDETEAVSAVLDRDVTHNERCELVVTNIWRLRMATVNHPECPSWPRLTWLERPDPVAGSDEIEATQALIAAVWGTK